MDQKTMLLGCRQTIIAFCSVAVFSTLCWLAADQKSAYKDGMQFAREEVAEDQKNARQEGMQFGKKALSNHVKFDDAMPVQKSASKQGEQFTREELHKQKSAKNEGMKFGKDALVNSAKFDNAVSVDELTPPDQRGKTFDAEEARKRVKEKNIPKNETYELLQNPCILRYQAFQPDEETFNHADRLVEQYAQGFVESHSDEGYQIETCLQHDAPFEMKVKHSLNVKVRHIPGSKQSCRVCKGHQRETLCWLESRKHAIKHETKQLASDKTIKSYRVERVEGMPMILSKWKHHDDALTCHNYKLEEQVLRPDRTEIEDIWSVDNPENEKMAHSPNCTFIKSERLGSGVKVIEGVEISRDNWDRIDTYMCRVVPEKCPFLNSYKCIQQAKKCKQLYGDQCSLWELTFKCRTEKKDRFRIEAGETFGVDEELWETGYEPNSSFSEAVTKLQVFEEMKKEFENSKHPDIKRVQLFGGKKSQCSKSVADDLMYDCCFSFHGLANELKLSKCTADEIALAEMREKGLCYYIGSYEEKFLNLWKSRTEHVYCCFPTKLARVLQQEGRKQLGIDWGTPKKPNCRGLTQDEIQRLNLSKIDLSEAYDAPPSIDMTDKIQLIQERLQRRLVEHEKV